MSACAVILELLYIVYCRKPKTESCAEKIQNFWCTRPFLLISGIVEHVYKHVILLLTIICANWTNNNYYKGAERIE